jgi:hypothetical protein
MNTALVQKNAKYFVKQPENSQNLRDLARFLLSLSNSLIF